MKHPILLKAAGMLGLVLLMSIAVGFVNIMIIERHAYQSQVKRVIAQSSAGDQTLVGPILVIPYTENYTEVVEEVDQDGKKSREILEKKRESFAYFVPEDLDLSGSFDTSEKSKGVYKALMYNFSGGISGEFRLPQNFDIKPRHRDGVLSIHSAYVSFGIEDPRGVINKPTFIFNGKEYRIQQASNSQHLGDGIHVKLGQINGEREQLISFEFDFNLLGMEEFQFIPIAQHNQIDISSSWPHPNFGGSFLPIKSDIGDAGFTASWEVSSFSSNNQSALLSKLFGHSKMQKLQPISISFVEPVNIYSQSDRATKYGLLFIGLTFAGFFLFEILRHLRMHPIQYSFVGLAMTLFYLLLVSFAERIGFIGAYTVATLSSITLICYYLRYVFDSWGNAFVFGGFLTALYSALFGILSSEDNALIMGSLLVFGILGLTMVLTRNIDWYQLGTKQA